MTSQYEGRATIHRCHRWIGAVLLAVTVGVSGCANPPEFTSPTADVGSSSVPLPTLSVEDLAVAIQVRTKFGLRADEGWIQHVARDPSAATYEGVAVTKDEEALLIKLRAPAEAVRIMVDTYGASKPDYAGMTTEWDRDGVVIAFFASDPEPHRQALLEILPEGARFEVVQVKYSRAELLTLARQVDASWLESIGAKFLSSGVDTARNQVQVRVSSSNPVVGPEIIAHYQAEGRMYVESDGVGAAYLPTGTLVVVAVDERGEPVPGLIVTYTGNLPGTGSGDVGFATGQDGRWQAELTATGYSIQLTDDRGVVGSALAHVVEGEVTTARIEVGSR